jgi:GTP cyclohydrolase IA
VKVQKLSYEKVMALIDKLAEDLEKVGAQGTYSGIYGVPRGGVPIAVGLADRLGIPLVDTPVPGALVVDDICDSGTTLARYPDHNTAVLFLKPHAKVMPSTYVKKTSAWIQFPWEAHETPAEDAIVRVLEVIGEDPSREGLLDTPKRVVKSYSTLFGGYGQKPADILKTTFAGDGYDQIVLLDNIEFFSTCEHHLLPFFGKAHVAYIPRKRVVGLSKLARLVDLFARRLQIQERLTNEIAGALDEALEPAGVAVVIEAQHFCMVARGVQKKSAVMTTSAMRGAFRNDEKARAEFMSLVGKSGLRG